MKRVEDALWDFWGADLPLRPWDDMQRADMIVLAVDKTRVWAGDPVRVYRGADAYVETLHEWAAISRGALAPEDITETWRSDDGPVEITFTLGGARHLLVHLDGHDDYLNMGIIREINRLIEPSGYRFTIADASGLSQQVIVLTSDEQAQLERDRGWEFLDYLT